jgi:hypothetical protein
MRGAIGRAAIVLGLLIPVTGCGDKPAGKPGPAGAALDLHIMKPPITTFFVKPRTVGTTTSKPSPVIKDVDATLNGKPLTNKPAGDMQTGVWTWNDPNNKEDADTIELIVTVDDGTTAGKVLHMTLAAPTATGQSGTHKFTTLMVTVDAYDSNTQSSHADVTHSFNGDGTLK